jgi:hypothetical protein
MHMLQGNTHKTIAAQAIQDHDSQSKTMTANSRPRSCMYEAMQALNTLACSYYHEQQLLGQVSSPEVDAAASPAQP